MRGIEIAMRRGRWWFALALGLLGACSNRSSNTKIMVAVWTNLSVPEEIESIRIQAKGSTSSPSFNFPLTTGSARDVIKFPVVWELISPDNQDTDFDIAASGYLGTNIVVEQSARLSFDPGHVRVLTLYLDRACMHATSGPCTQPIDIKVTSLPEYDPKSPFQAPDASPANLDAAGGGRAETGDVAPPADIGVGVDAPQVGDAMADQAKPDAGPATPADASGSPDGVSDTPPDHPATDDTGRDQSGPDRICANGCTQLGDASADLQALDAYHDAAPEALEAVMDGATDRALTTDVFRDSPPDLPVDVPVDLPIDLAPDFPPDLPPDLGRDVTLPDDAGACVLPMTTCTGACINPQANVSHCGGCGHACGTQNGTPSCAAAVCSMSACSQGFLDCSADENTSRNGCETNGNADRANCGHCGNVCASRVCQDQICLATARYGNTGSGIAVSSFSANYLAGIQIHIPNNSVVTGFGAVLYSGAGIAPATMYLGLYKDVAGSPGARVATVSTPTLVSPGGQEMNVEPPVPVTEGTYWILGVWDDLASFATNSATSVTWRYISYPYGPLPATAPTSMVARDLPPPNLFVIVAQ